MNDTSFIALRPIEKYTLLLFAFLPGDHYSKDLFQLMKAKTKGGDQVSAKGLCRQLCERRYLRRCGRNDGEYALAVRFSPEQLRELVKLADSGRWWPSQDEIDSMFEAGWQRGPYYSYRSRGESDFDYAEMLLIREFALGEPSASHSVVDKVLQGRDRGRLAAAVAKWVRVILEGEPDFSHAAWSEVMGCVLPAWLSFGFMMGEDRSAAMDYAERNLNRLSDTERSLRRVYAAMAVWRGEADRIERLPKGMSYADIREPMLHAASGDYAAADKLLVPSSVGMTPADPGEYGGEYAWRFLLPFVAAAAKPEKVPRTRPIALFKKIAGYDSRYFSADKPEQAFRSWLVSDANRCVNHWKGVLDGKGEVISNCPHPEKLSPAELLLTAMDYRFLPIGRAVRRPVAEALAKRARHFAERGYPLVALSALTLLKGGYDDVEYAPLIAMLSGCAHPFLPVAEAEPEWKNALVLLAKALPKRPGAEPSEGRSRASMRWYVSLQALSDGRYDVLGVYPAVRPPNGSADGSGDAVASMYDFDIGKRRAIMSDRDYLLAKTLQSEDEEVTDEVVECLCGMDNLDRVDGFDLYYGRRKDAHKVSPMTIERADCRLETSVTEDGGIVLGIPKWLSRADDYALRKTGPGRFEYVRITKEIDKIIETFGSFGSNQRLTIPKVAMHEAEPVLAKLAEVMPFAEQAVAGQSKLARITAASKVVVRLVYADGVLDARAAVRPIADNAAMTYEPGVGNVEKLVVGSATSYVLVRDLEAERAGLERVRSSLAGFEEWSEGASGWRFSDIEVALSALSALKSAEPPIEMEWPEDRKLKVSSAPKSGVQLTSRRTAEDWFRVDGEFKLDDGRVLGIVQLLEAAKSRVGNFVRLSDGDYVALTKTMARELDALNAAGRRKGDAVEIVKAAVPMLDGVFGQGPESLELPDAIAKTAADIRAAFAKKPSVPRTLAAELRPYQKDGYRWLSRLAACGFGSCLADDMGLGKTIQVLSLFLDRSADGASLVVAPSSVCGNWRNEIRRFTPTLSPMLAQESPDWKKASAGAVVIVSYGYLLFHADDFAAVEWNGLVLDEAQAIKNDAAKRAKCVKRLSARFRIAATGTPVENRLGELWSLMDFLNPGLLGSAGGFASRFTVEGKATPELKRLVKPLILRRLKGEVLEDLPPKTEVMLPITLGTAERTAYEGCRRHALATLAEASEGEEGPNRISILAELTRLRRFCCHPSLVLPDEGLPSAKLEALLELLGGLRDGRHRALVFSQFTDYLAIVRRAIDARGWSNLYLDGTTPTLEREALVNRFQGGEGDFFLISLKAGGTGLNLTAADYVILLDPWWNPAVENQAADRAHRIGQQKPVTIYRLIASDTVEERVIELHREKREIAEDVLDGTSSAALTPAQLMRLFG